MLEPTSITKKADTRCPNCQSILSDSLVLSGPERPMRNGDILLCAHCQSALHWQGGLLKQLSDTEFLSLPTKTQEGVTRWQELTRKLTDLPPGDLAQQDADD